jgi:predicted MPP superfamily phosphohydrolase
VRRAAAAAAAAFAVYAAVIEPRRLVTVRARLELPRWPHSHDGFRVALLSDLHAGAPHAGAKAIAQAVQRINAERPDVALLGGDYIDAHPLWGGRLAPELIARELAKLEPPTFAVLGNHDWKQAGDHMWTALHNAGIAVLENEARPVDGVYIAGLADVRCRRPDLPGTLATVPPDAPAILLAHDPDVFPLVPDRVAITLSGHTHGGQIAIPVLRRPAIPSRYGERFARGHIVEDGRHLYVTSGLGTSGLPVRLLAPPEIVVLELSGSATAT